MTESAKTKTETAQEQVLDIIAFQLDWWKRQGEKAREAVAEDKGSDWNLMQELATAFGRKQSIFELENLLERVAEEPARFTLLELLESMVERTQADLNRTRLNNSTSASANLIGVEKMYAMQALLESASGWLLVVRAAQPAS